MMQSFTKPYPYLNFRGFYIRMSSARVYPVSPMLQSNNDDIGTCRLQSEEDTRRLRNISMRYS